MEIMIIILCLDNNNGMMFNDRRQSQDRGLREYIAEMTKGVQMEAMSVEDKGEDIKFNVFVYNVQDGVKIDYETGDSEADSSVQVTTENSKASQKYHTNQNSSNNSKNYSSNKNTTAAKTNTKTTASQKIRGNSRSKVYHCPGQRDYDRMGTSKYLVTFKSEKEAKAAGYHKAQR